MHRELLVVGWYQVLYSGGLLCSEFSLFDLPGMQEIRIRSLGQEDTLEKEMATHSSTLAWRIP